MGVLKLSKNNISTFAGDIVTLQLLSDKDISSENIIWTSSNSNIAYVRDFKTTGEPRFSDGVLLVMMGVGSCVVTAEFEGVSYTCSVDVREPKTANKNDSYNFYYGDFHGHTSQNHDTEEFFKRTDSIPLSVLNEVKDEGFFDCFTISDHACLVNNKEFFRVFLSAEETQSSDFIPFPGTESEISDVEEDRHGVPHKNSGEVVTINSHGYASVKKWDEYFENTYKNPYVIAGFAHPQILGWSVKGIWNFSFGRKVCPEMIEMFRTIEVGNGGDRAQNLIHERMYSAGLDCGLKLSPVSTSDWHGPVWGATSLRGRTVILSPQKSKEMFIDAIRHNRVYATENGKVKLWYTVNGSMPGDVLDMCNTYKFHVDISYFSKPDISEKSMLLEVVSDYGKTIKKINLQPDDNISLDFDITSDTARYFYLKITSTEGDRTWSSPVWTGRVFDELPHKEFEGTELDKSKWSVIYCSNGSDPVNLISGGYTNPWISADTRAEFVIDMGEMTQICAIGLYPHNITRDDDGVSITELTARFISDYEMYIGDNDQNFTMVSKDTIRCYGEEKIDEFTPTQARYIKIKILSTAGSSQFKKQYMSSPAMVGEVYAYKK